MNNTGKPDQSQPVDNWEQMLAGANLPNQTTTNPQVQGDQKPKKKLQLKKDNVFVSNPDSKDDLGVFFKEEIEAFLKAKSGKMFQSASIPIPTVKTFTTASKDTGKKEVKKETKESKEVNDKEEKKEKELKAQEENKKKRELKRLEKEIKKKDLKKTVIDIDSVLKDKSKYEVEVDETRDPLNIVFIGHVDSGKSTICGGLLLWTGKVDMNELKKLEVEAKEKQRDSWYLAYLMDINEEEKAKGKTVEVGRATFELQTKRFTILDAPGHKNYVPNMIQGAAQADVACLVISAKAGEFESGFDKGGQTREHAMLARALGVTELIILVNKMDEESVKWKKERFDEIKGKLSPFLQKSCGYDLEKNVKWIPISGLFGVNIKDKLDPQVCSWYEGEPLLTLFDNLPLPKRDRNAAIRIPVLDKMKDQGACFVLGKVENGTVHPGQTVTFLPSCEEGQIVSVLNNDDKKIPYGKPGENVKLQIKGIDDDQITKGDIICSNENWTQVCEQFEAKVNILELPEHKPIMSNGYTCVLHMHTALEEVEIIKIVSEFDRVKKENKPSRFLKSGYIGTVRIQTKNPICCEKFDIMPSLGRFTLRDEGRTIAMGRISLIKPLFKAE